MEKGFKKQQAAGPATAAPPTAPTRPFEGDRPSSLFANPAEPTTNAVAGAAPAAAGASGLAITSKKESKLSVRCSVCAGQGDVDPVIASLLKNARRNSVRAQFLQAPAAEYTVHHDVTVLVSPCVKAASAALGRGRYLLKRAGRDVQRERTDADYRPRLALLAGCERQPGYHCGGFPGACAAERQQCGHGCALFTLGLQVLQYRLPQSFSFWQNGQARASRRPALGTGLLTRHSTHRLPQGLPPAAPQMHVELGAECKQLRRGQDGHLVIRAASARMSSLEVKQSTDLAQSWPINASGNHHRRRSSDLISLDDAVRLQDAMGENGAATQRSCQDEEEGYLSPMEDTFSIFSDEQAPVPYVQIAAKQMVGVYISVWVRRAMLRNVRGIQVTSVGTGVLGYLGNKGAALHYNMATVPGAALVERLAHRRCRRTAAGV